MRAEHEQEKEEEVEKKRKYIYIGKIACQGSEWAKK